jgi:cytochrome c biogenesis protein CcmG, thiol:disulfide interchange protein DsbE
MVPLGLAVAIAATPAPASVGQPAPAFSVHLLDGRTVTLASYRGKTLVLNLWAVWCVPCRKEQSEYNAAYAALHAPNVEFLGIDDGDAPKLVQAYAAANHVAYPLASDLNTVNAYAAGTIPVTVVIGPDGIVRARRDDALFEGSAAVGQLRDFVASAAAGKNDLLGNAPNPQFVALVVKSLDPSGFTLTGPESVVAQNAQRASDAIGYAGRSGNAFGVEPAIAAAMQRLTDVTIEALAPIATTDNSRRILYELELDRDYRGKASPAVMLLTAENLLAADPYSSDGLMAVANAYATLHQPEAGSAFFTEFAKEHPTATAYEELAYVSDKSRRALLMQQACDLAVQQIPDYPTYVDFVTAEFACDGDRAKALEIDRAAFSWVEVSARSDPSSENLMNVAWAAMRLGDELAKSGDARDARAAYESGLPFESLTTNLGPTSEAQAAFKLLHERVLALQLGSGGGLKLWIGAWTGAPLPGSPAGSIRRKLVVVGTPNATVELSGSGYAPGWLPTFCTANLCAPLRRIITLSQAGTFTLEFGMVRNGDRASRSTPVTVTARSGSLTRMAHLTVLSL